MKSERHSNYQSSGKKLQGSANYALPCICTLRVGGSANIGLVACDTVSSTSLPVMEVGQQFDTAKEVMDYVTEFAKRHFHPLRRSSCTTVEAYNRKVSTGMHYTNSPWSTLLYNVHNGQDYSGRVGKRWSYCRIKWKGEIMDSWKIGQWTLLQGILWYLYVVSRVVNCFFHYLYKLQLLVVACLMWVPGL